MVGCHSCSGESGRCSRCRKCFGDVLVGLDYPGVGGSTHRCSFIGLFKGIFGERGSGSILH